MTYFHAKLFGSHNVLHRNNISGKTYLIHPALKIYEVNDANPELKLVWKTDGSKTSQDAYHASLSFAQNDYSVIGDGHGTLYVTKAWKTIFQADNFCGGGGGKAKPFCVLSSLLSEDQTTISVLLLYVEDKKNLDGLEHDIKNTFVNVNVVEWVTLQIEGSKCALERVKRFAFHGEVESLDLCQHGIMYLGEEKPFQLLYDSNGMEMDLEESKNDTNEKPPAFYWMQGMEDIVVWVVLPEQIHKKEIKVILKPSHLQVKLKSETIIDYKLWNVIDSDSMTWTIDAEKRRLEISLCKADVGLVWQRFLAASTDVEDGEEVRDPIMVEKIQEEFAAAANAANKTNNQAYNVQELEACDDNSQVSRVLLLIKSHKDVQKVNIGDSQLLYSGGASSDPSGLNQFCVRHDVDGLVWQPTVTPEGSLQLEHVDTFSALGYVQASKSQRRYTLSSPDLSYAVIVDRARHIYLYRKPESIADGCELRNRKSGKQVQKVAKQQVPTLEHEPDDFVLGAVATSTSVLVATTKQLFCLKIH